MRDMKADLVSNALRKNVASLGANKYHYLLRTKIFENYPLSLSEMDNYFGITDPDRYFDEVKQTVDQNLLKMPARRAQLAEAHEQIFLLEQFLVRHVFGQALFGLSTFVPESYVSELAVAAGDKNLLYSLGSPAVNALLLARLHLRASNLPDELNLIHLLERMTATRDSANAFVYFATHIVIANSSFYTGTISQELRPFFVRLLQYVEPVINEFYTSLFLDPKLEYLLAGKMVGYRSRLYERIVRDAEDATAKHGYIDDLQKPGGIAEAEHRSMLYLGLMKWEVPWLE